MPTYDGSLATVDLTLTALGFDVQVRGTVELLAIRRQLKTPTSQGGKRAPSQEVPGQDRDQTEGRGRRT